VKEEEPGASASEEAGDEVVVEAVDLLEIPCGERLVEDNEDERV